jgi:hypothetical protein
VKDEERYNGWTNRATWNVNAWFANDDYLYEMVSVLKMKDASQFENFCRFMWGKQTPDSDNLNEVNWVEIAESWGDKE